MRDMDNSKLAETSFSGYTVRSETPQHTFL
jgi:hypothetical protein